MIFYILFGRNWTKCAWYINFRWPIFVKGMVYCMAKINHKWGLPKSLFYTDVRSSTLPLSNALIHSIHNVVFLTNLREPKTIIRLVWPGIIIVIARFLFKAVDLWSYIMPIGRYSHALKVKVADIITFRVKHLLIGIQGLNQLFKNTAESA